jgi:hypothetical protein
VHATLRCSICSAMPHTPSLAGLAEARLASLKMTATVSCDPSASHLSSSLPRTDSLVPPMCPAPYPLAAPQLPPRRPPPVRNRQAIARVRQHCRCKTQTDTDRETERQRDRERGERASERAWGVEASGNTAAASPCMYRVVRLGRDLSYRGGDCVGERLFCFPSHSPRHGHALQMLGEDGKSWLAKHFEIIGALCCAALVAVRDSCIMPTGHALPGLHAWPA